MFWGLVLEPSKKYTQKVDQTFHISQAALDLKSCDAEPIQLVVEYENSNFVLATLSKKANIFQVPLDLIFKTGDQVSFRTIGNGKVHLSGYHVLEDLDSMIMNGEESDVEMEEISKGKGKRKQMTPNSKGGKKTKLEDMNEDESEVDEDDIDEDFDEDEDDDFEEDEEDSEDMDEENSTPEKKAEKKKQKLNSSLLCSVDVEEEEDEDEEDEEDEEGDEEEEDDDEEEDEDMDFDLIADDSDEVSMNDLNTSKKKKAEGKKISQTPNGIERKGKDKSAQKLNKSLKQGIQGKEVKTPKSENKQKNEKNFKPGTAESTPQRKNNEGSKKGEKTQKSPKSEGSPQKKVLEGGVISEDIKLGDGPVAKPGKMANVYYVGCLASTKKEFDSVQSGGGFKFRIGRNEVIKGWDIGINGMKVGGKRKLTIPPHLAYGAKGSPPVIPPNSALVFTVELRGLS